jgi:hypothetical protein
MIFLGCHDGFLRAFDESRKYDEGTGDEQVAIDAYAMFYPMLIAPLEHRGRVIRTTVVTGGGDTDTDVMEYEIYVGDTARAVIDRTNPAEIVGIVIGADRDQTRKRTTGQFMGAYISNDTVNESFSFESFVIEVQAAGRVK